VRRESTLPPDLESTGPRVFLTVDAARPAAEAGRPAASPVVLRLAAVRFEAGRPVGRLDRRIRTDAPVPRATRVRLGLDGPGLPAAVSLGEAAGDLVAFIGDDPAAAHDGPATGRLLADGLGPWWQVKLLDGVALGRIVRPGFASHGVESLASALEIPVPFPSPLGAPGRAELAGRVWFALVRELLELPPPILSELNWMIAPTKHPFVPLLHAAERAAMDRGLRPGETGYEKLLASRVPPAERPAERRAADGEMVPEEVAGLLSAGGPLAGRLEAYEDRPEQIEMARAVAGAISDGRHLAVEAGTGVGKSLAYLVPACLHAHRAGRPVVVSTYTKTLQAQLFERDLPLALEALGLKLRTALVKGRRNYLCVRRLLYLMRESPRELAGGERADMLPLIVWAGRTRTGDAAECGALAGLARGDELWGKLTVEGHECLGRACPHRRRCFANAARARSLAADVVVANHALVFAELGREGAILPPYREIVFDEAHNVEHAATDHLACRVSPGRVGRLLNRFFRRRRGRRRARGGDESGTGLLPSLLHQLSRARGAEGADWAGLVRRLATEVVEAVVPVSEAAREFFDTVALLAEPRGDRASGRGRGEKTRYEARTREAQVWESVESAKGELLAALGRLTTPAVRLVERLEDVGDGRVPRARELARDLAGQVERARELATDLEFLVRGDDEAYVYWIEPPGGRRAVELWAAPVEVGPLLADQLYRQKRCVLLTSATLTVAGSFDFLAGRLGLSLLEPDAVRYLRAGTPFDYERQALVLVPSFLPDPSAGAAFEEALAGLVEGLFRATEGRAMALFTSYASLNAVYGRVKAPLEEAGLPVLGQGLDGPRERLLDRFRSEAASVLLGTHSFWEGVDVKGESLSCLVLAKLPFQVFTEPLVQARCERVQAAGRDPFATYTVPSAALRLRQGFGRLIRSHADRGVVVLADRRVVTRRYGRFFLRSLPAPWRSVATLEALLGAARDFLSKRPEGPGDAKKPAKKGLTGLAEGL